MSEISMRCACVECQHVNYFEEILLALAYLFCIHRLSPARRCHYPASMSARVRPGANLAQWERSCHKRHFALFGLSARPAQTGILDVSLSQLIALQVNVLRAASGERREDTHLGC
jgi:hypothetical protein